MISIFPVEHNGTVLHFAEDNKIADCGNHVLAIGNCSATLTSTFCQELPGPTCAQQLHSGGIAQCNTRPSHLDPIVVVDEGVIIINDETVVLKMGEDVEKTISGTFLVTYNIDIRINGSVYENRKAVVKKSPTSSTSTLVNITGHQEILSLPYLQRMNIENLRYIGEVKQEVTTTHIISGLAAITFLTICYVSLKWYKKRTNSHNQLAIQAMIDSFRKSEDGLHLSGGGVNTITQQQRVGGKTTRDRHDTCAPSAKLADVAK